MSDKMELSQEHVLQVAVQIAEPDFQMPPEAIPYWEVAGTLITNTRLTLGNEMAFSILLSRIMRELRRAYGVKVAMETLQGFLDTMDTASLHDR